MAGPSGRVSPGPRLWPLWLAWTVFVVYGSLVPLDFRPLPWAMAWQRLMDAPMLDLGIESRADWVANGVLYLPIGFMTTSLLMGRGARFVHKCLAAVLGVAFGWALALVVEFAQTAFPPRSVSRNDLLAEAIGTTLGMLAALGAADRLQSLLAGFAHGGWTLLTRLAPFYALAYLALAVFPYDLLVSAREWQSKWQGPQVGLWLAPSSLGVGPFKLGVKLALEVIAAMPLGALWWHWRQSIRPAPRGHRGPGLAGGVLMGLLLGTAVEAGQLAVASGQSQGLSLLTRSLGFVLGAAAWRAHSAVGAETLRAWLRRITWPMLGLNLLVLLLYNNVGRGPWLSLLEIEHRLRYEVRFVPFYYHYFTTEMHAVISLLAVALCFAPLGALGWAWHVPAGMVAVMALLLSMLMEVSKLLAQPLHPDPTNLLIAAVSAWSAQRLMQRLFAPSQQLAGPGRPTAVGRP